MTTNTDGLTNYSWQRSLSNTSYAYTHSNTGTIVYAGVNGHQVAGYVGVPAQQGGGALAEITFTAIGHGEGGLCLQVTGGTAWYQGDMNTSIGTLRSASVAQAPRQPRLLYPLRMLQTRTIGCVWIYRPASWLRTGA